MLFCAGTFAAGIFSFLIIRGKKEMQCCTGGNFLDRAFNSFLDGLEYNGIELILNKYSKAELLKVEDGKETCS